MKTRKKNWKRRTESSRKKYHQEEKDDEVDENKFIQPFCGWERYKEMDVVKAFRVRGAVLNVETFVNLRTRKTLLSILILDKIVYEIMIIIYADITDNRDELYTVEALVKL